MHRCPWTLWYCVAVALAYMRAQQQALRELAGLARDKGLSVYHRYDSFDASQYRFSLDTNSELAVYQRCSKWSLQRQRTVRPRNLDFTSKDFDHLKIKRSPDIIFWFRFAPG
jgi:hypothetical protein